MFSGLALPTPVPGVMVPNVGTPALWVGFIACVQAMLALDLGVFHRKPHSVRLREALI